MPICYRLATSQDAPALAELLQRYMHETYDGPWRGTPDRLERDAFGAHLNIVVAVSGERLVGFAAWGPTYDLHHCVRGVEIVDMFVVPSHRGWAVAVGLLATVAAHGLRGGAMFVTGSGVPTGTGAKLYERGAIRHGDKFYLSGRAFRALAQADPTSPRGLVRSVPARDWNFEG
jgi:GNAT superfamily N-acetyltransferase